MDLFIPNKLMERVEEWRNKDYKCDYPTISEILNFSIVESETGEKALRYLRKAQFEALLKSRRAERFVASLLALTSFGSYNVGYTVRSTRPNSAKGGTSYSPNTLSDMAGEVISKVV